MCRNIVDIQSAITENGRGKKKKEETTGVQNIHTCYAGRPQETELYVSQSAAYLMFLCHG